MPTKAQRGIGLLTHTDNHGTAYSSAERHALGLRGLLPPAVGSMENQKTRALANLRRQADDLERYVFMQSLMVRHQKLYYRLLIDHIEELMPIVYTPTVGQACQEFGHLFREPHGFYITPGDRGEIREILDNWPEQDVRVIVVTDGERILGLGDLGASGMGIPIGKLALYCACAGLHPRQCLPVMLDVGTNNRELREDPMYLGIPEPRLTGQPYFDLVDEFVRAVNDKFPNALIQFEDFSTPNAHRLLDTYRDTTLCFNDDIQGTASVALAGLYGACRIARRDLTELKVMFLGAGSAATGIAHLLRKALMDRGLTHREAAERIWLVDLDGLVVASREDLPDHHRPFAHDCPSLSFHEALDAVRPDALIGATGCPGTFDRSVITKMCQFSARPVVFALSNPTSRAECTARQVYEWSEGQVIFASGSPFAAVELNGQVLRPGQGNNAYIFPGVGLGATFCRAQKISDEMFLAAAETLADCVSESELALGSAYPPLPRIREVSLAIAEAVVRKAHEQGLSELELPDDLHAALKAAMYDPGYEQETH